MSRYYNGVLDNGATGITNPICNHSGDHPAVSSRFLHIEQKRCLVGTSCFYNDPDTIRTAAHWTEAVSDAFDAPTCTDDLHNGNEGGIDCGGACPLPCSGPTCTDGLHNGDEEDIDCGGSCPDACGGGSCLLPDESMGCTKDTLCCSGVGNCTKGRPSDRVCR